MYKITSIIVTYRFSFRSSITQWSYFSGHALETNRQMIHSKSDDNLLKYAQKREHFRVFGIFKEQYRPAFGYPECSPGSLNLIALSLDIVLVTLCCFSPKT